jgi:hypothetical protein
VGDSAAKRGPILLILAISIALFAVGGVVLWRAAREPLFDEPGTFVLDPRDGHPMVCSSGKRIHFSWDGEVLAVTPGPLPPGEHQTRFRRYRELTSTVQLANKQFEVDGDVIATALSPTAPEGWQRCLAVTVGKGRRERIKHRGGGDEATTEIQYEWEQSTTAFYDYYSGKLEAEIDLNGMFTARRELMLRTASHDIGEMEGATVMAGSLGMDKAVAMTAQFRTGEHSTMYETGVLDREMWHVVPSGYSGYGIPQEVPDIFVGPEDKTAVVYGMTTKEELLAFFELSASTVSRSGTNIPSARFQLRRKNLFELVMTVLLNALTGALAAAVMSGAVEFILAGIWHFLLPRRAG